MQLENKTVTEARNGNKKALEKLYKTNFEGLYIFVRHKVDNDEKAEDICSESFLRAFEGLQRFKENSSFKSWLYGIAKNLVYDFYKSKGKEIHIGSEEFAEVTKEKTKSNTGEIIKSVMSKLKENYRQVLELRFLSNLSIRETAEAMDTTENNIKVLQNRALKKAHQTAKELNFI